MYRELFLKHFACRLLIFGFVDLKKDHGQQRGFASVDFQPAWCEAGAEIRAISGCATLRSQDGGAMETSRGIGVAVVVERITPSSIADARAFIRVDDVELTFDARPRNDDVTV